MKQLTRHLLRLVITASLLIASTWVHADPLRDSLFSKTDELYEQAKNSHAEMLAPINYNKAYKAYQKADNRFKKNQSLEKIKKDLATADTFFRKALEASKLADISFSSALKARSDAIGVEAPKLSKELWEEAEESFREATQTLEKSSLKKAKKKAKVAEEQYRDAELTAIKASYLNKTRSTIAKAKKEKVDRYAPLTLADAERLLGLAEKELSENRYDTDYPRSLAKQSLYQAKHSIFIANYMKELKEQDVTIEQLLLEMEKPVIEIANTLDMVAEFDQGFEKPTGKLKGRIEDLINDSYELRELKGKMASLEKEYAVLEERLGIQSRRVAAQEAQQRKLAEMNRLFKPHEAIVLTQGENIIIRAVGLSFDSGSSKVNTRNHQLLNKLQKVFKVFADYRVVVEGHTDSFGGDAQNLALSFDRANAVREYLLVNMQGVSESRSEAKGYGETRPIANNETASGRHKNRRIDLVLIPSRI